MEGLNCPGDARIDFKPTVGDLRQTGLQVLQACDCFATGCNRYITSLSTKDVLFQICFSSERLSSPQWLAGAGGGASASVPLAQRRVSILHSG